MSSGLSSGTQKHNTLEPFGLIPTVRLAVQNSVGAVQLFLNDTFAGNQEYLANLVAELKSYDGEIILHLPDDFKNISDTHLQAAEFIMDSFPDKDIKVLTHYQDGMTVLDIPKVNRQLVGIENSKTGSFDKNHVISAFALAKQAGTFFVFDHGRIMYKPDGIDENEIYEFIQRMIENLDPEKDILHSADKTSWTKRYRDSGTYLGDPAGIGFPLLAIIASFINIGGTVIFEQESEDEALHSIAKVEG